MRRSPGFLASLTALSLLVPVLAAATPSVVSVTPNHGPTRGGIRLTITGTSFGLKAGSVQLGGAVAVVDSWADVMIVADMPEGDPGPVDLVVADELGLASPPYAMSYDSPVITSVSPPVSATRGGVLITIRGENFGKSGSARTWNFGSTTAAEIGWVSHEQIFLESPPGTEGSTVDVSVVANGVPSNVATHDYAPAPVITSITPSSGPAVGGIPSRSTARTSGPAAGPRR